jgi:cytosine/adenosine deaminase-related metal-dependent hydrolase
MANGAPRQVDLALTGAALFLSPDTAPIRDGVILISNGKIVAAGRGIRPRGYRDKQTIDCSGLFITAGFWNNHIHFASESGQKPRISHRTN